MHWFADPEAATNRHDASLVRLGQWQGLDAVDFSVFLFVRLRTRAEIVPLVFTSVYYTIILYLASLS
jgi:hypothetical protein